MQEGFLIGKKQASHSGGWDVAILIILYFLLLAPVLPEVSTYHSDECFYTDSATYMMRQGDWIIPHYPDGSLRVKKPIITYWTIAASYGILGINYFATRLPFLIAGCLTILMGYALSRSLFRQNSSAVLAAVILISNIQLIHISIRSTPDMLQCLFMNISLYGFSLLIFHQDTRLRNYIMAYAGAALAIETKGFLGVTTICYAWIFVLCSRKPDRNIRHLVHTPTIVFSLMLATGWFAWIYLKHGGEALSGFFQDQAGTGMDAEGTGCYILSNLVDYFWGVFRHFLPWILLLLIGIMVVWKEVSVFVKQNKRAIVFVCGWFLFLLAIFINGKISRTRYLLPTYPMLSVLVASFLTEMLRHKSMTQILRYTYGIFLIFTGLCAVVCIAVGLWLEPQILIAGILLLLGSASLGYVSFKIRKIGMGSALGVNILFAVSVIYFLIIPIFRVSPSEKLAECILQHMDRKETDTSVWSMEKYRFTGQINVFSQGRITVFELPQGPLPDHLFQKPFVVLSEESKSGLNITEYDLYPGGYAPRSVKPEAGREALESGDPDRLFHTIRQPYYLAKRKE